MLSINQEKKDNNFINRSVFYCYTSIQVTCIKLLGNFFAHPFSTMSTYMQNDRNKYHSMFSFIKEHRSSVVKVLYKGCSISTSHCIAKETFYRVPALSLCEKYQLGPFSSAACIVMAELIFGTPFVMFRNYHITGNNKTVIEDFKHIFNKSFFQFYRGASLKLCHDTISWSAFFLFDDEIKKRSKNSYHNLKDRAINFIGWVALVSSCEFLLSPLKNAMTFAQRNQSIKGKDFFYNVIKYNSYNKLFIGFVPSVLSASIKLSTVSYMRDFLQKSFNDQSDMLNNKETDKKIIVKKKSDFRVQEMKFRAPPIKGSFAYDISASRKTIDRTKNNFASDIEWRGKINNYSEERNFC